MDNLIKEILLIILAPAAAIITSCLNSRSTLKSIKINNDFQISRDERLFQKELEKIKLEQTRLDLLHVYKNLCLLQREFSLTSMNIDWEDNLHEQEYNKKYFKLCNSFDNSRAIIAISYPELLSEFDDIYGKMNIYWGNFNNLLRKNRLDKSYESQYSWHQETFEASQEIVRKIQEVKHLLSQIK